MKEYLLCAAIHYDDGIEHVHQPKNVKTGIVVCGRRHHNIIASVFDLSGRKTFSENEQGFVTSHDRFVTREQGAFIAYEAGQIKEPKKTLYSEDLY